MTKRSELLNNLISLSAEKLKEWAQPNSKEYIHLLRELIIQGMVSLLEPIIKIRVRQQDRDNAVKLFPECEKEFSEISWYFSSFICKLYFIEMLLFQK